MQLMRIGFVDYSEFKNIQSDKRPKENNVLVQPICKPQCKILLTESKRSIEGTIIDVISQFDSFDEDKEGESEMETALVPPSFLQYWRQHSSLDFHLFHYCAFLLLFNSMVSTEAPSADLPSYRLVICTAEITNTQKHETPKIHNELGNRQIKQLLGIVENSSQKKK